MKIGFTKKRCPKCNGNIFIDRDSHVDSEEEYNGWYEWCLQCGYTRYLKPTTVLMEEFKLMPAAKELAVV